jgi:hypothetical protein
MISSQNKENESLTGHLKEENRYYIRLTYWQQANKISANPESTTNSRCNTNHKMVSRMNN